MQSKRDKLSLISDNISSHLGELTQLLFSPSTLIKETAEAMTQETVVNQSQEIASLDRDFKQLEMAPIEVVELLSPEETLLFPIKVLYNTFT